MNAKTEQPSILRVGFINYLNCLPLLMGLEATGGLVQRTLSMGMPTQVNAWLSSGQVDIGLISSICWAEQQNTLQQFSAFGIAADGEVMSVLLVMHAQQQIKQICNVGLTGESATSRILAKIVLERAYELMPTYEVFYDEVLQALTRYDALVIIGNLALKTKNIAGLRCIDLGRAWKEYSGLPMVYAVWAGRHEPDTYISWQQSLECAVQWSEEHLDMIVGRALSTGVTQSKEDLQSYFSRCIRYRLGPQEQAGLRCYLAEHRFLSRGQQVK